MCKCSMGRYVSGVIYALRGWMAFVAFIHIGLSIQSFVEQNFFLGVKASSDANLQGAHLLTGIEN